MVSPRVGRCLRAGRGMCQPCAVSPYNKADVDARPANAVVDANADAAARWIIATAVTFVVVIGGIIIIIVNK